MARKLLLFSQLTGSEREREKEKEGPGKGCAYWEKVVHHVVETGQFFESASPSREVVQQKDSHKTLWVNHPVESRFEHPLTQPTARSDSNLCPLPYPSPIQFHQHFHNTSHTSINLIHYSQLGESVEGLKTANTSHKKENSYSLLSLY